MPTPRRRILAAAEQVFGHKGYNAATVREICQAARVNLAALNYYFGSKEALYRTVVTDLLARAIEAYPADMGTGSEIDPEQRLELFIRAMLHRLLGPGGLSGYQSQGRLLARELADPSPVLDTLVADHIRPQAAILGRIITALIGPQATYEQVMKCAFSIIGQCFYYGYAWPITMRLHALDLTDPATIEALAEHITRFSLNGLRGLGRT
jgi:TetR/AcrR family transcriptional regulator, regulator of cefoperazone and chloramphenicol sensitivity